MCTEMYILSNEQQVAKVGQRKAGTQSGFDTEPDAPVWICIALDCRLLWHIPPQNTHVSYLQNSIAPKWNIYFSFVWKGRSHQFELMAAAMAKVETRWSPRTRMLTRMLMVQMSKHMVMQSRTKSFCNSLYLNSLVHVSLVTNLQCGVESVECGVWSVKWSKACGV